MEKMEGFSCGLDISTACCGYNVLNCVGKLVEIGYVVLNKPTKNPPSFYERARMLVKKLKELHDKYDITHVFIEAPISSKGQNSNTNTIIMLLQFNAIISYECGNIFGFDPVHIQVKSARAFMGIPQPRGVKPEIIKHKVFVKFTEELGYEIPVEYKRTGKIREQVYDQSDSLLISYVGMKKHLANG